ncbi:MAG: hypothetical protein ABII22_06610 [Candidatus Micrarchaeota archaeon]
MDKDEIILTCKYKGFNIGKKYEFDKPDPKVIAGVLSSLSEDIEQKAFELSGIDTKKIDELVSKKTDLIEGIRTTKKEDLLAGCNNDKPMIPIAESYFLNKMFKKFNIPIRPAPNTSYPSKKEEPSNVVFIGNVKPWFAARKILVGKTTEDYEISGVLSAANYTIVNKSFEFFMSTIPMAGEMAQFGQGERKSFANLAAALEKLRAFLLFSKSLTNNNPDLVAYNYFKVCSNVGFNKGVPGFMPYANTYVMVGKYPDLKIKKPKGRVAKG